MTATVFGEGLGLYNSSLSLLGQSFGQNRLGQGSELSYVNAYNGNLVLQHHDQSLVGLGIDTNLVRTYNSQGKFYDGDNNDQWRMGFSWLDFSNKGGNKSKKGGGASEDKIVRWTADGFQTNYFLNQETNRYESTDGSGAHDYILVRSDGSYAWYKDGDNSLIEVYNDKGQLTQQEDRDGNQTLYSYHKNRLVDEITNSGQSIKFNYNPAPNSRQLASLSVKSFDEDGNSVNHSTTFYQYDELNRLERVVFDLTLDDVNDNKEYVTEYSYKADTKLVETITQSDGTTIRFDYDDANRIQFVTDGVSNTTEYRYETGFTRVIDPQGNDSLFYFDEQGRLLENHSPVQTNGTRLVSAYTYDADGNVSSISNADGHKTSYQYDDNGNLTIERDALGNTISRTYNSSNLVLTESVYLIPDPDGDGAATASEPLTNRYLYESEGHLRFVINSEGEVLERLYDDEGNLEKEFYFSGHNYDVSGLTKEQLPELTNLINWSNSIFASDTSGIILTQNQYNARGQIEFVTRYDAVDENGNGDLSNGQASSTTYFAYDYRGLLLKTVTPRGIASADIDDDFVSSFNYDGMGRVISSEDAEGNSVSTQYFDGGRIETTTPNGLISTAIYDQAGRLLSTNAADSANSQFGTTENYYDSRGLLVATRDEFGAIDYLFYDDLARLTHTVDATGAVTEFKYDARGNLNETTAYASRINIDWYDQANNQVTASEHFDTSLLVVSEKNRVIQSSYDAAGRLDFQLDAEGTKTTYFYDGASRLIKMEISGVDGARQSRTFYDEANRVVAVLDGEGYLVENIYDEAGRLVKTIAYAGAADKTLIADANLAELKSSAEANKETGTKNIINRMIYDNQNRLVATIDAENYLTESIYNLDGLVVSTVSYFNPVEIAVLDSIDIQSLRPTADIKDQVSSYTYDQRGLMSNSTDYEGAITQYFYDKEGQLTNTIRGTEDIRGSYIAYDAAGRAIANVNGKGFGILAGQAEVSNEDIVQQASTNGNQFVYDSQGRMTQTIDANGNTRKYFYDLEGRQRFAISADGSLQENRFNAFGEIEATILYDTKLTNSQLSQLQGGLVAESDIVSIANSLSNESKDTVTEFAYNARGQLLETMRHALDSSQVYSSINQYNSWGEIKSTTSDINLTGRTVTNEYHYDNRGLLTSSTQDLGGLNISSNTKYDAFGRAIEIRDANNNLLKTSYDNLGRVVEVIDPSDPTKIRKTTYDAFGRVYTQTDSNNQTTTYIYNDQERSLTTLFPEGVSTKVIRNEHGETVFVFDAKQNKTEYLYDKNGQLEKVIDALDNVIAENVIDEAGRVIDTFDANGNKTHFSYDANNRVLSRSIDPDGLNITTSYEYDGRGQIVKFIDANLVATTTEYDKLGQINKVTVDPDGLNLVIQYQFDAQGNQLKVIEAAGQEKQRVTDYQYDNLGRLETKVIDPSGLAITESFKYDDNGNLIERVDPLEVKTYFAYDEKNQLLFTLDGEGYVSENIFDSEGNLLELRRYLEKSSLTSYTKEAFEAGTSELSYQSQSWIYDGLNRQRFAIDAENYVTETRYDDNGNVVELLRYTDSLTQLDKANIDSLEAQLVAEDSYKQKWVFDVLNRQVFSINTEGYISETLYDDNSNVIESRAYHSQHKALLDANNVSLTDVTTIIDINKSSTHQWFYDKANRQRFSINAESYVVEQRYDSLSRVVETVQYHEQGYAVPALESFNRNYEGLTVDNTKILRIDPESQTITRYGFDAAGRQTYMLDAEHYLTESKYDALSQKIKETRYVEKLGQTGDQVDTHYLYDAAGHQIFMVDGENYLNHYEYDAAGQVVKSERYAKALPTADYSNQFIENIVASYNFDGIAKAINEYSYDNLGRVTSSIDREGYLTDNRFDALGNLVETSRYAERVRLDDGSFIQKLVLNETLNAAQVHHQLFDGLNRQRFSVDSLGYVSENIYDSQGNIVEVKQYDAIVNMDLELTLENLTLLLADQNYRSSQFVYNELGQAEFSIDALGYVTRNTYDYAGRVTNVYQYELPLSSVSSNLKLEQLASEFDTQANVLASRHTETLYDNLGNAVEIIDAKGISEHYQYDAFNQVESFTNKKGVTWTYQYDKRGNLTDENLPLENISFYNDDKKGFNHQEISLHHQMEYDYLGNLITRVEAKGVTGFERSTIYKYDSLGRQVETHHPKIENQDFIVYTEYDAYGNAIRNTDARGFNSFKIYDNANQERFNIDAEGFVTEYVYDSYGNQTDLIRYSESLVNVSYESKNAIAKLDNEHGIAGHDPISDKQFEKLFLNALDSNDKRFIKHEYDLLNRRVISKENATQHYNVEAKSSSLSEPQTHFTYNAFGELIKTSTLIGDNKWANTYAYFDKVGNQTTVIDSEGYISKREYNALGELVLETQYANAIDLSKYSVELEPLLKQEGNSAEHVIISSSQGAIESSFDISVLGYDRAIRYGYDKLGRQISKEKLDVQYFDESGLVQTGNLLTRTQYDSVGNAIETLQKVADGTEYSLNKTFYNKLGQTLGTLDAARAVIDSNFNASILNTEAGLEFSKNKLRSYTSFEVDVFGNVLEARRHAIGVLENHNSATAPAINDNDQVTKWVYDIHGRVTEERQEAKTVEGESADQTSYYEYDRSGNITSATRYYLDSQSFGINDPDGPIPASYVSKTTYEYDKVGRQVVTKVHLDAQQDANLENHTMAVVYNAFGEVVARGDHVRSNGQTKEDYIASLQEQYNYDNAGRVKEELQLRYEYDASSEDRLAVDKLVVEKSYEYNEQGLVAKESHVASGDTYYSYDSLGRITEKTRYADITQKAVTFPSLDPQDNVVNLNELILKVSPLEGFETYYEIPSNVLDNDGADNSLITQIEDQDFVYTTDGLLGEAISDFIEVTTKQGGTLRIKAQPDINQPYLFQYKEPGSFSGIDSFSYSRTLSDGKIVTSTVYISVDNSLDKDIEVEVKEQQAFDRWGNVLQQRIVANDVVKRVTNLRYNQNDQIILTKQSPVTIVNDAQSSGAVGEPETIMGYDLLGRQVFEQDARGFKRSKEYNELGQLTKEKNALGYDTHYAYDIFGREIAKQDSRGNITTQTYDQLGQVTQIGKIVVSEDESVSHQILNQYKYDALGNRVVSKMALSIIGNSTTWGTEYIDYDSRGNVVKTTNPSGISKWMSYDKYGNQIAQKNMLTENSPENRDELTWVYDYFGKVHSYNNLSGKEYVYNYNDKGQLINKVSAIHANLSEGSESNEGFDYGVSYEYFSDGNLKAVYNADVNRNGYYKYDEFGQRVYERTEGSALKGKLNVYYDQITRSDYDSLGRLSRVVVEDAVAKKINMDARYFYDAVGNRTKVYVASPYSSDYFEDLNHAPTAVGRVDNIILEEGDKPFTIELGDALFHDQDVGDELTITMGLEYGEIRTIEVPTNPGGPGGGGGGGFPTDGGDTYVPIITDPIYQPYDPFPSPSPFPDPNPFPEVTFTTKTADIQSSSVEVQSTTGSETETREFRYVTGISGLPHWMQFNAENMTLSINPEYADSAFTGSGFKTEGRYALFINARDRLGALATHRFEIKVTPYQNKAPWVDQGIEDYSIQEGQPINYPIAADAFIDKDGDPLEYRAYLLEPNPNAGQPIDTGGSGEGGDGDGGGSGDGGDTGGGGPIDGGDGTIETQNLKATLSEDEPDIPTPPVELEPDYLEVALPQDWLTFENGTFSGMAPLVTEDTAYKIRVYAQERDTLDKKEIYTDFNFKVLDTVSEPFTVSVTDGMVDEGGAGAVYVKVNGLNHSFDNYSFEITLSDGKLAPDWITPMFGYGGAIFVNPANGDNGTYNLKLIATDLNGVSEEANFTVVVNDTLSADSASVNVNDLTLDEDVNRIQNFSLGGGISYFNTSYQLQMSDGSSTPNWISVSGTGSAATINYDTRNGDNGTYQFKIIATDNNGNVAEDTFQVVVRDSNLSIPNRSPEVNLGLENQVTTVGYDDFSYTFSEQAFSDPDGDSLSYSASGMPSWMSFDAINRTFAGTQDAGGTHNITVTAVDSDGASVSTAFSIVVNATNVQPQLIGSLESPVVAVGDTWSRDLSVYFIDPNQDPLTYSATLTRFEVVEIAPGEPEVIVYNDPLPSWMTIDSNGYFSATPQSSNLDENPVVRLAVSDGVNTTYASFQIHVEAQVNETPQLKTAISPMLIDEGATQSFTIPSDTFVDPEGQEITYSAQLSSGAPLPSWIEFITSTRTFTVSPQDGNNGITVVKVIADDGNGGVNSTSFAITVNDSITAPVNNAPIVISGVPDVEAIYGQNFSYIIPASAFSDPDGDELAYSVQYFIPEQTFFEPELGEEITFPAHWSNNLPTGVNFDSSTRTLTGIIAAEASSNYQLRAVAEDPLGLKAYDEFNLTLMTGNNVPALNKNLTNQIATVSTVFNYTFANDTFIDSDNDPLSYSASGMPSWMSFDSDTRTFSGTPTVSGSYAITVTADDGRGASVSAGFALTVEAGNQQPELIGSLSSQTIEATRAWNYDVAPLFSDPNGDSLTFSATITRIEQVEIAPGEPDIIVHHDPLPSWMNLTTNGQFSGTPPTSAVVQDYTVRIAVSDGQLITYRSFIVDVVNFNNQPPELNTAKPLQIVNVNEGETATAIIPADMFNDPDGHSLTYSATLGDGSALPSWISLDSANHTFSFSPQANDSGSYDIKVIASDGYGGTANGSISLEVADTLTAPTNSAPILNSLLLDRQVTVSNTSFYSFSETTFTDPDGDVLTYNATLEDGSALPAGVDFYPESRSFEFLIPAVGSWNIKVTATDPSGASVSDTFNLNAVNIGGGGGGLPGDGGVIEQQSSTNELISVYSFDSFKLSTGLSVESLTVQNIDDPVDVTYPDNFFDNYDWLFDRSDEGFTYYDGGGSGGFGGGGFGGGSIGNLGFSTHVVGNIREYRYAYDAENQITFVENLKLEASGTRYVEDEGTTKRDWIEYDSVGNQVLRITSNTDDVFGASRFEYDAQNRLTHTYNLNPEGRTANFAWSDASVREQAINDELGDIWQLQTQKEYDQAGRVVMSTEYHGQGSTKTIEWLNRDMPVVVGEDTNSSYTFDLSGLARKRIEYSYKSDGRVNTIKTYEATAASYNQLSDEFGLGGLVVGSGELLQWQRSFAPTLALISTVDYSASNSSNPHDINNAYDADGKVQVYKYTKHQKSDTDTEEVASYTHTYRYSYLGYDSYVENRVSGTSSHADYKPGTTWSRYDKDGNRISVMESYRIEDYNKYQMRYFRYNADGQIIRKDQGEIEDGVFTPTHLVDTDDGSTTSQETNYQSQANGTTRFFYSNGQYLGQVDGFGRIDFDDMGYQIVDKDTASTDSQYTVNRGDTLRSIAQAMYGNGELWYIIADANGINEDSELINGLNLKIPAKVNSFNNSETFKAYNPAEIVGDTTPGIPFVPPPPPTDNGCGIIGTIIMVVVAVVVTIYLGPEAGGTFLEFAAAAAAGSIASQAVGIAIGHIDSFSWKQVAVAAITAGITSGINLETAIPNATLRAAATHGINSVISQGVNIAVGLQDKFDWRQVATAAVAGGIAQEVGLGKPTENTAELNQSVVGEFDFGNVLQETGKGIIRSGINHVVNQAFGGTGKFDFAQVAADAFGNALGEGIAGHIKYKQTMADEPEVINPNTDDVTPVSHGVNDNQQNNDSQEPIINTPASMNVSQDASTADNSQSLATGVNQDQAATSSGSLVDESGRRYFINEDGSRNYNVVVVQGQHIPTPEERAGWSPEMRHMFYLNRLNQSVAQQTEELKYMRADLAAKQARVDQHQRLAITPTHLSQAFLAGQARGMARVDYGLARNAEYQTMLQQQQQFQQYSDWVGWDYSQVSSGPTWGDIASGAWDGIKTGAGFVYDLGAGVVNGAIDMVYQPIAQIADLGQVALGLATFGRYEPTWLSNVGITSENGGSGGDIFRAAFSSHPVASVGLNTYDGTIALQEGNYRDAALNYAMAGLDFVKLDIVPSRKLTKVEQEIEALNNIKSNVNSKLDLNQRINAKANNSTSTWQAHEAQVSAHLTNQFGDTNIGNKVYLQVDVPNASGGYTSHTIIPDHLIRLDSGDFRIADAKFSGVKDLNALSSEQLKSTFTKNQKPAFQAIADGTATVRIKNSQNGVRFFGNPLNIGQAITIDPQIHIYTNTQSGFHLRKWP